MYNTSDEVAVDGERRASDVRPVRIDVVRARAGEAGVHVRIAGAKH